MGLTLNNFFFFCSNLDNILYNKEDVTDFYSQHQEKKFPTSRDRESNSFLVPNLPSAVFRFVQSVDPNIILLGVFVRKTEKPLTKIYTHFSLKNIL